MSFPNSVRNKVLLKCKRHCCLCGQYAGINMELHHIKQKSDGGDDSEDNCIPLCFNCHASVKSYNPHHPKGLKYSEEELKLRRNEIYEFVKNKVVSNYMEEDIEKAKRLLDRYYQSIENIICIDPCGEPVNIALIDYANDIVLDLQSYGYEFINKEIDEKKCNLIKAVEEWSALMCNEKYFHVINTHFLCFNSDSVNSYREIMWNIRIKIKDSYLFLKTIVLGGVV